MLAIRPHLWLGQAKEAAEFYTSLLPDSEITSLGHFAMGAGQCQFVEYTMAGQPFMGISLGDAMKFTPAISFMINFDPSRDPDAAKRIDEVWNKLVEGGTVMMAIGSYPFSERYGWLADKYGMSWQLILTNPTGEERPVIMPSMMFTGDVAGKAEEAQDFYTRIFKDGRRGNAARYPKGMEPDKEGTLMFSDFYIDQTWITAMDSAHPHGFGFNDALSLLIPCESQEEIDELWSKLTADGGQPGQCGWLKDKFGVSWQVSTALMTDVFKTGDQEQIGRLVSAFMPMSKIDLLTLQKARDGE